MDVDIEDCIEMIHQEYDRYGSQDMVMTFYPQWRKILQNVRVALWARSEEETMANLALPSYKSFILRLAEQGLGYKDGIRSFEFMFLRGRKFNSFQVFSLLMAKQFLWIVIPRQKILTYRGWKSF
jgi:hypothetical protein